MLQPERIEEISQLAASLLGTGGQTEPFSRRFPGFDLRDAYDVVAAVLRVRFERGETPVGRKIGFTNRAIWDGYRISGPIWNYMFDSTLMPIATVESGFRLGSVPEPRIEPEVVLHLAREPRAGMTNADLLACIDWVAPAFEIVHSIFPNWQFTAADAAAACGIHTALLMGTPHALATSTAAAQELSDFSVTLRSDRGIERHGHASHVLGGPLNALRFLVEEIPKHPGSEPLRAGEIVATGTLTEAMPVQAGDIWMADFAGIPLPSLRLSLR